MSPFASCLLKVCYFVSYLFLYLGPYRKMCLLVKEKCVRFNYINNYSGSLHFFCLHKEDNLQKYATMQNFCIFWQEEYKLKLCPMYDPCTTFHYSSFLKLPAPRSRQFGKTWIMKLSVRFLLGMYLWLLFLLRKHIELVWNILNIY